MPAAARQPRATAKSEMPIASVTLHAARCTKARPRGQHTTDPAAAPPLAKSSAKRRWLFDQLVLAVQGQAVEESCLPATTSRAPARCRH